MGFSKLFIAVTKHSQFAKMPRFFFVTIRDKIVLLIKERSVPDVDIDATREAEPHEQVLGRLVGSLELRAPHEDRSAAKRHVTWTKQ